MIEHVLIRTARSRCETSGSYSADQNGEPTVTDNPAFETLEIEWETRFAVESERCSKKAGKEKEGHGSGRRCA